MGLSNYVPNSRLAQPGVCTSTTRPATPYEGQVIYETDTNRVLVWDASAWVMIADTDQPPGLQLVKSQIIPATATTSVDVTSVFSSEFDDYKVFIEADGNGTAVFWELTLLSGATPTAASGYYFNGTTMTSNSTTVQGNAQANAANFDLGAQQSGTDRVYHEFEMRGPFKTEMTQLAGRATTYVGGFGYNYTYQGEHNLASSYDGFRVSVASGSFNTGSIRVYGYRN